MTDFRVNPALSQPTTDHLTALKASLAERFGDDEDAIEQAFTRAVRSAWVHEEPWAQEYVAALSTRADSLNGALELAEQTGWEPADTVAALPGMDQQSAHTLLSALHAAQVGQQDKDKA
ncbi:hypothetical protein ACWD3I_38355 [Streptomyces sp. NPDC002817]|uniref:hypothetical protein n=1 Tax=Streptomyces sp. NPDC088357 TaxID=3154655 RepID=UPI00343E141C